MSTDTSFVTRSHEENWLPVLELAVEEVFEIMLGCRVKPVAQAEHAPNSEFTAMIGLAGALCGVITVCCSAEKRKPDGDENVGRRGHLRGRSERRAW